MVELIQQSLSWLPEEIVTVAIIILKILVIVLPLMGAVAYLTYAERKIIGFIQVRIGPNRVGFFGYKLWGLGQPIADGLKLLMKETILPTNANRFLFLLGPVLTLAPALAAWAVIPFDEGMAVSDLNAGLLYILAMTSMGVYGVIIAGWASNSKYAFLGAGVHTVSGLAYVSIFTIVMLALGIIIFNKTEQNFMDTV